jgi:hypothetical protein
MQKTTKEKVIQIFLNMVNCFVPLARAKLATLGGQGIEAKLWQEHGLPPENGWLIERSRDRARQLIAGHRYRTHNQLQTFHQILAGYGEEQAHIDGFHLDLCGTFGGALVKIFSSILPLVLNSDGRCLAITVADQRRNVALEQWPQYQRRAKHLFGNRYASFYTAIKNQQERVPVRQGVELPVFFRSFNADKAAKREVGLLVELSGLLCQLKLVKQPVEIERYIYVSRFHGRPFRMRTYLFHFGQNTGRVTGRMFADTWISSKLVYVNDDQMTVVNESLSDASATVGPPNQPQEKGDVIMRYPSLNAFMSKARDLAGPDVMKEFSQLLLDAERLDTIKQALGQSEQTQRSGAEESPARKRGLRRRKWEMLTPREQIEWQVSLLEHKAKAGGVLINGDWKNYVEETFGYYDAHLGRSLRSAIAHCSGKFRPHFVNRIKKVLGDDAQAFLDRLSKIQ